MGDHYEELVNTNYFEEQAEIAARRPCIALYSITLFYVGNNLHLYQISNI